VHDWRFAQLERAGDALIAAVTELQHTFRESFPVHGPQPHAVRMNAAAFTEKISEARFDHDSRISKFLRAFEFAF
jgi:hypothetical protein